MAPKRPAPSFRIRGLTKDAVENLAMRDAIQLVKQDRLLSGGRVRVTKCEWDDASSDDGTWELSAEVQGGQTYEVWARFLNEVVTAENVDESEFECNCPYGNRQQEGACKHVSAMLLSVLDDQLTGKKDDIKKTKVSSPI
jgi:hypothetical protein